MVTHTKAAHARSSTCLVLIHSHELTPPHHSDRYNREKHPNFQATGFFFFFLTEKKRESSNGGLGNASQNPEAW
jgi:hypothetical protein